MASNTFSKTVTEWELLVNTVAANIGDLDHLAPIRFELINVLQLAMELGAQQDRVLSMSQDTSRAVRDTMRRGEALAARLRAGIRAKYGFKSEKLTEFQIRPLARHSRVKEPPPQPEAPAPDPTAVP